MRKFAMPKKKPDLSFLGGRLRAYRESEGLTLKELASLTNIAQPTLSEVENAKYDLSAEKLSHIIRNTNINPIWLLTGEGEMFSSPDRSPSTEPRLCDSCCVTDAAKLPQETRDLLSMAVETLTSDTKYARLLTESIRSLHESIRFTRRLETLEENVHEIQETVTRWAQHTLGKEMEEGQPAKRTAGLEDPPVKDHQK